MSKKLRKALDDAITGYIKAFEKKHDVFYEWAVVDDLTGILNFGDHYFSMSDIVEDIDKKYKKWKIFEWKDAGIKAHFEGNTKTINLRSYMMGLRYESV
jgi:hypothetical protein